MSDNTYTLVTTDDNINPDLFNFFKQEIASDFSEIMFKWEYYHDKSVFVYFEKNKNQVVGTYGAIPIFIEFNAEVLCSAKSESTYIKSTEQGIGLYESMHDKIISECKNKNIKIIWGFTGINKIFYKRLGFFADDTCLKESIIIIKPKLNKSNFAKNKSFLNNIYTRYIYHLSRVLVFNFKIFFSKKLDNNNNDFLIAVNLKNNNDIIELFDKIRKNNPKMVNLRMDIDFLNHRIFKNPFNSYLTYFLYNNQNELLGYVIICINKKTKVAYISDLTAVDINTKEVLLKKAFKEIKNLNEINSITLFGNIKNILINDNFELFKKYGAKKYQVKMSVISNNLDNNIKDINSDGYSNWYINGLWTEGLTQ